MEKLREITHEADSIGPLENTQRPGQREIPAQSEVASNLFIDQKDIGLERFCQQDGFALAPVQRDRKDICPSLFYDSNLKPCRKRQHAAAHYLRRFRICQLLVHGNRNKDLLK